MREPAALQAALALAKRPAQVRRARRQHLPPGITFLLEVAAGDDDAVATACRMTGRADEVLRQAAGFYIEQALLSHGADSYRVLGSCSDDPRETLRRHMVLLMKWLHPDVAARHRAKADVDRSVFANRIAEAWDNLKTADRRAAYDVSIRRECSNSDRSPEVACPKLDARHCAGADQKNFKFKTNRQQRIKRRVMQKTKTGVHLFTRVARLFKRRG